MPNFAKYSYLNSYLKKFKQILPSETLTVPELHDALRRVGFKPDYGTMYEIAKLNGILSNKYLLDKLRFHLGIIQPKIQTVTPKQQQATAYTEMKPIPRKEPNYFSDEEMKNASDELLKNDGVYNENKTIRITQNDIRNIVTESVKKILKEEFYFTNDCYNEIKKFVYSLKEKYSTNTIEDALETVLGEI